jgi:hypothetical protein
MASSGDARNFWENANGSPISGLVDFATRRQRIGLQPRHVQIEESDLIDCMHKYSLLRNRLRGSEIFCA